MRDCRKAVDQDRFETRARVIPAHVGLQPEEDGDLTRGEKAEGGERDEHQ
jgi:hypothetical protein